MNNTESIISALKVDEVSIFNQLCLLSFQSIEIKSIHDIELNIEKLIVYINNNKEKSSNSKDYDSIINCITFNLGYYLHSIVFNIIIESLNDLNKYQNFWLARLENGGFYYNEIGLLFNTSSSSNYNIYLSNPFNFSLKLWLHSIYSKQRTLINSKISLLHEYEANFNESAGEIYSRMYSLKHASINDIILSSQTSSQLIRFLTGKDSPIIMFNQDKPHISRQASTANMRTISVISLLELQLETLRHINVFHDRVKYLLEPLVPPSRFRRYWIWYAIGGIGSLYFVTKIIQNRNVIADSGIALIEAMITFFQEHVFDPARNIITNLFTHHSMAASKKEFSDSQVVLDRMLTSFAEVNKLDDKSMTGLMIRYEKEVQNPIKNALSGVLLQGMLIQLQKLKVDVQSSMLSLDQLIESNEISLELGATIPAILVLYPLYNSIIHPLFFARKMPSWQVAAKWQLRLYIWKIDRVLTVYNNPTNLSANLPVAANGALLQYSFKIEEIAEKFLYIEEIRMLKIDLEELRKPNTNAMSKRLCFERLLRTQPVLDAAMRTATPTQL